MIWQYKVFIKKWRAEMFLAHHLLTPFRGKGANITLYLSTGRLQGEGGEHNPLPERRQASGGRGELYSCFHSN
jgi:hypothetical protein